MLKIGIIKRISGVFLLAAVLHSLFYFSACRTISFGASNFFSEKTFLVDFNKSMKKMINDDMDEEEKKNSEEEESPYEKEFKNISEYHLPKFSELDIAFIYQIKIRQIEKENYTEQHIIDILIPPPKAA